MFGSKMHLRVEVMLDWGVQAQDLRASAKP